jgi:hypothetical protein
MSLERDCHDVEVIPSLELLCHFWYELGGSSSWALYLISLQGHIKFEGDQKFLEKSSLLIRYEKGMSLENSPSEGKFLVGIYLTPNS